MSTYHGKIIDVTTRSVGAEVAESVTAGTVVLVRDGSVFDPSGGVASVEGVEVRYVSAAVDVGDPDVEEQVDSLTFEVPVTLEVGDRIELLPSKEHVTATVRLWDDAEPVPCVVPLELRKRIPEGVRADPELAETVTVDITGGHATVVDLVGDDGHIKTTWQIDPGGAFVAGDPDGTRAELSDDGLRVWQERDGVTWVQSQLTTEATSLAIHDNQGTVLGGITQGGDVTGATVSTESLAIRGVPMLGTFNDGPTPGWFDRLPWGTVTSTGSSLFTSYKTVNEEWMYLKASANLRADRRYRISVNVGIAAETTGGVTRSYLRVSRTATDPTVASEELAQYTTPTVYTGTLSYQANYWATFSPSSTGEHRFGVTYRGMNGSRAAARGARVLIEDIGPMASGDSGGDEGSGSTTVRYTTVWKASAARTYDKNGARIAARDNLVQPWYWRASPTDFQSPAILFSAGADRSSHSIEAGKTISAALSGATNVVVTLRVTNRTWFGDASVRRLPFGQLGFASLPSTLTASTSVLSAPIPEGRALVQPIPSSWFTGSNRGIVLGEADGAFGSTDLPSGIFGGVGDADGPELTIEYTR